MKKFRTPNLEISESGFKKIEDQFHSIEFQIKALQESFYNKQIEFRNSLNQLESELNSLASSKDVLSFFLYPEFNYSRATVKENDYWIGRVKIPKSIVMVDGSNAPRYLNFIVGDLKTFPDPTSPEFKIQLEKRGLETIRKKFDSVKKV